MLICSGEGPTESKDSFQESANTSSNLPSSHDDLPSSPLQDLQSSPHSHTASINYMYTIPNTNRDVLVKLLETCHEILACVTALENNQTTARRSLSFTISGNM